MRMENPEHVASALMMNGLDHTRAEITSHINERYGTTYSSRDVSDTINAIETEAKNGKPESVFLSYVGRGIGARSGMEIITALQGGQTGYGN